MKKNIFKQGGVIGLVLIALLLAISWGNSAYANDADEIRQNNREADEIKQNNREDEIRQNNHEVEVDPQLLAEMDDNGRAGYLIYFSDKADLSPAYAMDWEARGHFVVNTLRETAEISQKNVRAYLEGQEVAYRHFWIDNIIAVDSSDMTVLNGLLSFSEIATIQAKVDMFLIEPEGRSAEADMLDIATLLAPEPNLVQVKATDVWALGFRGDGTVIANIDSGVRHTHEALVGQYRGHLGGGSFDHDFNWLDPDGGTVIPTDTNGHGTHVMGTMVGYDGGANEIGVAPESDWIACRGCPPSGCSQVGLLACAEWIAAPYAIGDPGSADPDMRPHAVNNSWGNCQQVYNDWYQGAVDSWHAAGVFPIFANGNASNCGYASPPGLNTVGNPARYGNVTGVGSSGTSNGQYAPHSNWGPTDNPDTVNPEPGWADLKPQVIAPGVTIRSSLTSGDSAYGSAGWTGTSMSAPHVTGMIALLWQAAPCLIGDYATTETLIEQSATPILYDDGSGPSSPNQATGWGEIDILAAVQMAQSMCGPTGSIEGTVTEDGSGTPLADVNIEATLDMTTTLTAMTDAQGEYAINFAPTGFYTMTAAGFGYLPATVTNVEVISGTITTQDFTLTPAPSAVISGTVSDINTGWPLYAQISVDDVPGSPFWTDPETGYYSITLPEGSTYDFTVSAFVEGYLPEALAVGPVTGDMTVNVGLDVNVASCTAPGYVLGGGDFYDFEANDGGFMGTVDWEWGTNYNYTGAGCDGTNYPPDAPFSGDGMWATVLNGCYANSNMSNDLSFSADLTSQSSAILQWWDWYDVFETFDFGEVYVNNTLVYDRATSYVIPTEWEQHQVDLTPFVGGVVDIEFRMFATTVVNRAGWYIDDVLVGEPSCTPQAGGLVVGNVYDENTDEPLVGALVAGDDESMVTVATPDDPNVDDGFYTIFAPEGSNVLTATHTSSYGSDTTTINVGDGETILHHFELPSGWLQADPDTFVVNVLTGTMLTLPLNLHNLGGLDADFQIQELPGGYSPTMTVASQVNIANIAEEWETMAPLPVGSATSMIGSEQSQSPEADQGTVVLSGPAVGTRGSNAGSIEADPWVTVSPAPLGVSRSGGAVVNDLLYVVGGESTGGDRFGQVQIYDPATDTWDNASAPTMLSPVSNLCAAAIGTNIYVPGGWTGTVNETALQVFDTAANSWGTDATDPLPAGRYGSACASHDGKLYVFGGWDGAAGTSTAWVYDPNAAAGSRWSTLANAPFNGVYGAALSVNGLIFYGGISDNASGNFDMVAAYNPASDVWTSYPSLQVPRGGAGMWAVGDTLYIGGGGWASFLTSVEAYDTTLGTGGNWEFANPLNQGRRTFAYATDVVNGHLYAVTGWAGAFLTHAEKSDFDPFQDVPWLSQDPEMGTVAAGDDFDVQITFTAYPTMSLGVYTATMRIINSTVYGSIDVPVTMRVLDTIYGVELDPAAASAADDPGESVSYTLTITNTGTESDTFDLMLSGNAWDSDLSTASVTLAAGASTTFMVTVHIPAGLTGPGHSDMVTVTAESTNDPFGKAMAESVLTTEANEIYRLYLSLIMRP